MTKHQHGDILISYVKNVDEDSRLYAKISASRRQCEGGMTGTGLNITSELQAENQITV
ncbi:hypothetical protein [uncultured Ruminococcus sp.]|uniref:hypothetical protein n=1 Tax=Ruminococcus sp. TaxID=41978 RepID=UPI002611161A|nr:hypothetical protein [uncultured Ruminococcus sp.]